jgi:Tol biopolymer transport system component
VDSQTLRRPLFALALLATLFALTAPAHAAFPGKNGKIAIAGIFTFNADGSEVTLLASGNDPAWSPDGKQIAFSLFGSIYVMDQNGLNQRLVTTSEEGDREPTWSPDGKSLAFVRGRTMIYAFLHGPTEIYSIRLDGSQPVNLTRTPTVIEGEPAWSPDGEKIAFSSHGNIYVLNADGSGRTQLTDYPPGSYDYERSSYWAAGPNWSPDGAKLLYARDSPGNLDPYDDGLQVINADGSGDITIGRGEKHLPMAAWSPDGRYIVYDVPTFGFYLYDVGTTRQTQVVLQTKPDQTELRGVPDWQPIPGPKRSDYKNSRQFCRADRAFLGEVEFRAEYGTKSGANAFGKCVARG